MADSAPPSPYGSAAGGWGSLKASVKELRRAGAILRGTRALRQVNQDGGFDCPGCAWPEPADRSTFEFCENGVKAVAAEATSRSVGRAFFAKHTVAELSAQSGRWLEAQGRLAEPLVYDPGSDRYVPVSWEDAFERIGAVLRELATPDEALFYTSGRTSNEAAFLYQLFGRELGTNNFPDCSNMCHESSGSALGASIGIGKGTVTLADFDAADGIFVIGQNPGTNHPRMLTVLERAARRGAAIVSINPLKERGLETFLHPQRVGAMMTGRGTTISQLYLQPLVGGDMALIKGMMKCVIEAEDAAPGTVLDHDFIGEHTVGSEEVLADCRSVTWDWIEAQSGLSRAQIGEAAKVYLASERVIICWAMGLTQQVHSVATLQTVVNLMLLRGNLGKPGAGLCPVRGHSNVQGDRTVGITERPKAPFLDALGRVFGFTPPRKHGLHVVDAIGAMAERRARGFVGMGGNFVAATPDRDYTERAVRSCALTVQISTKLNRSHLVHGDEAFILPCLARSEVDVQQSGPQRVTVEDSMSMVHASRGRLAPSSDHLMSEPAIVAGLAKAALPDSVVPWDDLVADYARIRDKIAAVIPGFEGYDQRIDEPGGFYLGNSAGDRRWLTASGKAEFKVHPIPDLSLPSGQLRLMTMRSHDQYNTTIYSDDDRYRGIRNNRRVILCHPKNLDEQGLSHGDHVDIVSCFPDHERRAEDFTVVAYNIPAGCAGAYFPETNVLVSVRSTAEVSGTPTSKFIPIRLVAR